MYPVARQACLLCYNIFRVFQSPAVQHLRETSRDRNGETKAGVRFFYGPPIMRGGILFTPHARRIMSWLMEP